jgi:hypothetical protein
MLKSLWANLGVIAGVMWGSFGDHLGITVGVFLVALLAPSLRQRHNIEAAIYSAYDPIASGRLGSVLAQNESFAHRHAISPNGSDCHSQGIRSLFVLRETLK